MTWFDKLLNWFDGANVWGPDMPNGCHSSEERLPLPPAKDHIEELYTELGGEQ